MVEQNETSEGAVRLQAYLARCGVASRRASEAIILEGRVSLNGRTVRELGTKMHPGDLVELDGKPLKLEERKIYLALHKPEGYICSSSDPQGRPMAKDLLPQSITERVYNVGRLDLRSSGLILFTNDGGFAAKVGHPSAQIEKEYIVVSTVYLSPIRFLKTSEKVKKSTVSYTSARISSGLGKNRFASCL